MTQPNPFLHDSMNASPRLREVAAAGMIKEEDLRRTLEVANCTTCGEEVLIMDGSDPVCAQCYLGVEHITREGAEVILGGELEITRAEYESGYEFFVLNPQGMCYSEEQFYAINAKMILSGYPVEVPERHKAKQELAVIAMVRDQILCALGDAPDELREIVTELFSRDDIIIDPKAKTIKIGVDDDMDSAIREVLERMRDQD